MSDKKQARILEARLAQRNAELAFLADGISLDVPWRREKAADSAFWPKFRNQPVFSTVMLPGVPDAPIRGLNFGGYPPMPIPQPANPPIKPPPKQDLWPSDQMMQDVARERAHLMAAQGRPSGQSRSLPQPLPLPLLDPSYTPPLQPLSLDEPRRARPVIKPRPFRPVPVEEEVAPEPLMPAPEHKFRAPRRPNHGAMTPISVVDSFHQGDADRRSEAGDSPAREDCESANRRAEDDAAIRYLRRKLPDWHDQDWHHERADEAEIDPPVVLPRHFSTDADDAPLFRAHPLHREPAYLHAAPLLDEELPAYDDDWHAF